MKFLKPVRVLSLAVVLGLRTWAAPTADEIIAQLKARSSEAERAKNNFAYQRTSRVDYLDDRGEVKRNSVRVYEVTPLNGKPVSKLVQVNGRAPTGKEENSRSAARQTGDQSRGLELGDDLLSRYSYRLMGEEKVGGRSAWILEFTPRVDAEENGFLDRLLNAMRGTMWVDQNDFALVKVDVHLSKKVSFFGGIAGAIEQLDLQIVQKRLDEAAWLTEGLSLDFTGRKLFSPIRFRCFETCSGFRKVTPLAAN